MILDLNALDSRCKTGNFLSLPLWSFHPDIHIVSSSFPGLPPPQESWTCFFSFRFFSVVLSTCFCKRYEVGFWFIKVYLANLFWEHTFIYFIYEKFPRLYIFTLDYLSVVLNRFFVSYLCCFLMKHHSINNMNELILYSYWLLVNATWGY